MRFIHLVILYVTLLSCNITDNHVENIGDVNNDEGLTVFEKDGLYGYINSNGKVVIKPVFEYLSDFSEGLALFGENGKYGYINLNGEKVIEAQFDYAHDFSNGRAVVGFIDTSNILDYDEDGDFYTYASKEGAINSSGKIVIQPIYDQISYFSHNLAYSTINKKKSIIDIDGNVVLIEEQLPKDCSLMFFQSGLSDLFIIEKGGYEVSEGEDYEIGNWRLGKYGFMDIKGNIVLEPVYNHIGLFNSGLACVSIGQNYGYMDTTGKIVINLKYDYASDFSDGLAYVEKSSKRFFINTNDEKIFECDDCDSEFSNGLTKIKMNKLYGFINTKGEVIIPCKFSHVYESFKNGLAIIEDEYGNKQYINTKGDIIVIHD
jgi:hypothetical protein